MTLQAAPLNTAFSFENDPCHSVGEYPLPKTKKCVFIKVAPGRFVLKRNCPRHEGRTVVTEGWSIDPDPCINYGHVYLVGIYDALNRLEE